MTRYYYEKRLPWGELQDPGDNWVDAGFDWLLENGPADRQFGPDSPMTQNLMTGRGVGQARDAYSAARASGEAPPVGRPFRYRYDFGPLEFLMAWLPPNGTSHFLGSYDVFITDQGDGSLNFSVTNVTNWASGTNLRLPGTEAPLFSEELRPTGPHDMLMPTYSIPFKTILPGWQRGESFYGAANLGGAYTQSYVWTEPLTVAPAQP